MTPPPAPDPCARTIGWPRSPVVVFGIAASFFVIMGTIFSSPAVFNSRLPVVLQGQITRVPAGYLVLLVAAPFAIFALMYWVAGFEGAREYEKNPTRIHFVCTLLSVLEAVRVYLSWATTAANSFPESLTSDSFGGATMFLILGVATFIWNLWTSRRKSVANR